MQHDPRFTYHNHRVHRTCAINGVLLRCCIISDTENCEFRREIAKGGRSGGRRGVSAVQIDSESLIYRESSGQNALGKSQVLR
jgi:hypothetical protein